jgi:hypothetical protein
MRGAIPSPEELARLYPQVPVTRAPARPAAGRPMVPG